MILNELNCPNGNRVQKEPAITITKTKGYIRFNLSAARMLDFADTDNFMSFEMKDGKLYVFWDMRNGFNISYKPKLRMYLCYNLRLAKTLVNHFGTTEGTSLRLIFGEFKDGKYELHPEVYYPKIDPIILK